MCFPQAPSAATAVADGATSVVTVSLVAPTQDPDAQFALTQAVIRIIEAPKDVTTAAGGPVWAELWLQRNEVRLLLDKGYIRAGGARGEHSVVGIQGSVGYEPGDTLEAQIANDTGATITYIVEHAVDFFIARLKERMACDNFTALSTDHTGVFIYEAEPKNGSGVGSAAGDVTLTLAPAAGDQMSQVRGWFQNLDAVNSYTIRAHANEDGTTDAKVYWNYLSLNANGVAVGANGFLAIPNAFSNEFVPELSSPLQFFFIVPALATGAQIRVALAWKIQGRKPVVTLVSPTAGATPGAANVNTNKVV